MFRLKKLIFPCLLLKFLVPKIFSYFFRIKKTFFCVYLARWKMVRICPTRTQVYGQMRLSHSHTPRPAPWWENICLIKKSTFFLLLFWIFLHGKGHRGRGLEGYCYWLLGGIIQSTVGQNPKKSAVWGRFSNVALECKCNSK